MHKKIMDLIDSRGSVSFVELDNEINGFSGGDLNLLYPHKKNVFIWFGMTEEGLEAIKKILEPKDSKYCLKPTIALTYVIDGKTPQTPLAKQARNYKTPHWLPMVFDKLNH